MLTFRSIFVSSLILGVVLSIARSGDRFPETAYNYHTQGLLSAQTDQKEDAGPYRGSGRRGFRDTSTLTSVTGETLR